MNLTLNKPLVFFDVEGTGLDISNDKIVSICVLRINPDGTRLIKDALINPELEMKQEVIDIHGITNEMVKDKPTFKQISKALFEVIKGCDLAGFNSNNYDIPLLAEEFLRCDINFPEDGTKFIDVGNIFKKKEERTLSAAMKFYCGKELEGAHDAKNDVIATFEVFKAQIERYQLPNDLNEISKFSSMDNRVDLAGKIALDLNGDYIYNFGKNKGMKIKDDTSFAYWMMGKDFTRNTLNVLSRILQEISQPDFVDDEEKF